MTKRIRSKTNTVYFSDIPKPEAWREDLFKIMRDRYRLRTQRTMLVEEARELRKRIYGFSTQINALQEQEDKIIMSHVINKNGDMNE